MDDYYQVLGIGRDADAGAVRSAFRKLAKKYHPDANPGNQGAEQKFKEINQAYEVLKDKKKRATYDRAGHAAYTSAATGSGPAGGGAGGGFGGFGDVFADIMGGEGGFFHSRGNRRPGKGSDLQYDLTISLKDAFQGKKETIHFSSAVACDRCHGSGAAPGSEKSQCGTCHGHGVVRNRQGFLTIETPCPQCGGEGSTISQPCPGCSGEGRKVKSRELRVSIPPGVDEGNRIRIQGKGEHGYKGAPAGDFYVSIHLTPHSFFHRDGHNLTCHVPIPMTLAALGGKIEVPMIEGSRVELDIPAGTQSGHKFRLRGKGMPVLNAGGRRGDVYMVTNVETPRDLTPRQKQLLEQFGEETSDDLHHPKSAGFFDKLKKLFEQE